MDTNKEISLYVLFRTIQVNFQDISVTRKYVCIWNLHGKSPLHIATLNGNTQLLIEKGADPNYRDHYVTTKYIRSSYTVKHS